MNDRRGDAEEATNRVEAARKQSADGTPIVVVCDVLLDSLRTLADTGEVDLACRLAGRACVTLRRSRPDLARRFDVLLHRLTPKLTWEQPPTSSSSVDALAPEAFRFRSNQD